MWLKDIRVSQQIHCKWKEYHTKNVNGHVISLLTPAHNNQNCQDRKSDNESTNIDSIGVPKSFLNVRLNRNHNKNYQSIDLTQSVINSEDEEKQQIVKQKKAQKNTEQKSTDSVKKKRFQQIRKMQQENEKLKQQLLDISNDNERLNEALERKCKELNVFKEIIAQKELQIYTLKQKQ